VGTVPTPYEFTGQRLDSAISLYYYVARHYDPMIGVFVQADTIVPGAGNPQAYNRYAYALNSPLRYTDPSGHDVGCPGQDARECPQNYAALYLLIKEIRSRSGSALDVMNSILAETLGYGNSAPGRFLGSIIHSHTSGIGGLAGDVGFAPEFQDDHLYQEKWGQETGTSTQLGHLLSAIDMGIMGSLWIPAIVGHEQSGDPNFLAQGIKGVESVGNGDSAAFFLAVLADAAGATGARDAALQRIYNPQVHGAQEGRNGNSMGDLRLSARGFRLGGMLKAGDLKTSADLANWIALNVAVQ